MGLRAQRVRCCLVPRFDSDLKIESGHQVGSGRCLSFCTPDLICSTVCKRDAIVFHHNEAFLHTVQDARKVSREPIELICALNERLVS